MKFPGEYGEDLFDFWEWLKCLFRGHIPIRRHTVDSVYGLKDYWVCEKCNKVLRDN